VPPTCSAAADNDKRRPCWATLQRWPRDWRELGGDVDPSWRALLAASPEIVCPDGYLLRVPGNAASGL